MARRKTPTNQPGLLLASAGSTFPPVGETVFLRGCPVTVMEVRSGPDTPDVYGLSGEKLQNFDFEFIQRALLLVRGANTSPCGDEWVRFEEVTGWL